MTAEIAILNKTAVALASDSAATISSGNKEEKIFDSADKLFELCTYNPIGIMIYHSLSFSETPLPALVRGFRSSCKRFSRVEDCANAFLEYLDEFGRSAPDQVKDRSVMTIVRPLIEQISERFERKFKEIAIRTRAPGDGVVSVKDELENALTQTIDVYERVFSKAPDASYVNPALFNPKDTRDGIIDQIIAKVFPYAGPVHAAKLREIGRLALKKDVLSDSKTGLVIAGFGGQDLFPTLVAYEIDGVVCGSLKYRLTQHVDIDRSGPTAKVIPFAQKEMVERFLYGLDDEIERNISTFCQANIGDIHTAVLDSIELGSGDDRKQLEESADNAVKLFLDRLKKDAFDGIREKSRAEIEDMVEFMPKPELATMAEALVNLTSLKRRVSRGMETVGGPIDVAVISQSEGFVWIKRKHYFPPELNARYLARVERQLLETEESHGTAEKPRSSSSARTGSKGKKRPTQATSVRSGDAGEAHTEGNSGSVPDHATQETSKIESDR